MSLKTDKPKEIVFSDLLTNFNFKFDFVEDGVIFLFLEGKCSEAEVRKVYPYELDYTEFDGKIYLSIYI